MEYLLITPNTDTFANPTLVSIFCQIQSEGGVVHLFGPVQQAGCPEHIHCVEQHVCDFRLYPLRNPKHYLSQLRSYHMMAKYVREFGIKTAMVVDPMGVVVGGRLCRYFCKGLTLSYLSFEIFFRNELSGYYLHLKDKEIAYSRYISSVLSQDENRLTLLCAENNLPNPLTINNKRSTINNKPTNINNKPMHYALIPVSTEAMQIDHSVDIHERFGIAPNIKTVVYSGSIGSWCGTDAILNMFERGSWPNGYHLVFHTRRPLNNKPSTINDSFESRILALDADPTKPFSLHAHPFDSFNDLGAFLKGFDAALALYYPNNENAYYGRNMQEIGLSSGKFSMYMMLGLPTIVTPCQTYEQLLEKYHFGAILTDENRIEICLNGIDNQCSSEAKRLYDEVLQPDVKVYMKMLE